MRRHMVQRWDPSAVALVAVLALAALGGAGCSRQPDTSRASVESCVQFGITAVRHHVTVTSLPPACRGLTAAQVDFAAGAALHSAGAGARGKAQQRRAIGEASHLLAHMFVSVPAQRSAPPQAAPAAGRVSRAALGLTALCCWLVTVGLGLWMMARWILRRRAGHAPGRRLRRPPPRNLAHLGLASVGLLIWIAYLATGMTGLAWTASALLVLVTGLGMTLLFVPYSASPAKRAAAQPAAVASAADPASDQSPHRWGPRLLLTTGAHIIFATVTMLFAVLTAIGPG